MGPLEPLLCMNHFLLIIVIVIVIIIILRFV